MFRRGNVGFFFQIHQWVEWGTLVSVRPKWVESRYVAYAGFIPVQSSKALFHLEWDLVFYPTANDVVTFQKSTNETGLDYEE
jgi:hypothetical protein